MISSVQNGLLVLTLLLPAMMLGCCLMTEFRRRVVGLLWAAPLPSLAAACLGVGESALIFGWDPHFFELMLDRPGALLLGTAALLWIFAGLYAKSHFGSAGPSGFFLACWLLTLIGSLGIFMAQDVAGFLVFYALVGLPAYGLILSGKAPNAGRASSVYLGFALLGEGILLLAFILLMTSSGDGSWQIASVVNSWSGDHSSRWIGILLIAGFGMKIGMLPFHFWMPLAYTAAPIPAAAVLSGAAVNAGIIGMIRFLPAADGLGGTSEFLIFVGFCGAFLGVALGLCQRDPKAILAYSSVSQMGFLAVIFGAGLGGDFAGAAVVAAFYAAHHTLVKGGLFLAVGLALETPRARRWGVLLPAGVVALGLAGLPLTGGALAKIAAKLPLGVGLTSNLAIISAMATALLMFHFLRRLSASIPAGEKCNPQPTMAMQVAWLATASACVLVPWLTFAWAGLGSPLDSLSVINLGKSLGPVVVGGLLAVVLIRITPILPAIPPGDIASLAAPMKLIGQAISERTDRMNVQLSRWPVAGLMILLIVAGLAICLLAVGYTTVR